MRRQSFLLFKNSFKQIWRNKTQIIGLILLVLLSSLIFTLMRVTTNRIINEYETLNEKSNLHDFIFDLDNTNYIGSLTGKTPEDIEQITINDIAKNINNSFSWSRVESRTFELPNNKHNRILKTITANYYSEIDKLVIIRGSNIGEDLNLIHSGVAISQQAVVNKEFADNNNIKIGSVIRIQPDDKGETLLVGSGTDLIKNNNTYNWFYVTGFGISADFVTPIIDQTTPLPNKKREGIIYVHPSQFGLAWNVNDSYLSNGGYWLYNKSTEKLTISSNADREIYYVGKWNSSNTNARNLAAVSTYIKKSYLSTTNKSDPLVYSLFDHRYRFAARTSLLETTVNAYQTLLTLLLLIVLFISGITIALITRKNIDNAKVQIGILKALGYTNWKIMSTALTIPLVGSLIGCLLVYIPASFLQITTVNIFAQYFNLNFGSFYIDYLSFIYCLILTFGFLGLISMVITGIVIRSNPIELIKSEQIVKMGPVKRAMKKSVNKAGFYHRFWMSLFTSSMGKMTSVGFTMLLGTTLMTTSVIGPKIMADNQKVSYTGMNYKSAVEYAMPAANMPMSMFRTYNPQLSKWNYTTSTGAGFDYYHPDRYGDDKTKEILAGILENKINQEYYAPTALDPNASDAITTLGMNQLSYLGWKSFTKSFLDGLDRTTFYEPSLGGFIIGSAWPDGMKLYNFIMQANPASFYTKENYEVLRTFYRTYRSTIAMHVRYKFRLPNTAGTSPKDIDYNQINDYIKEELDTNRESVSKDLLANSGFMQELTSPELFEKNPQDNKHYFHLENEEVIINHSWSNLSASEQVLWSNKVLAWFMTIFYGSIGQAVAQGTYSQAPYFIKQQIANAFQKEDTEFNLSFNTVPFDPNHEELGTYFRGTTDQRFNNSSYKITVYGLQSEDELHRPSYMQLDDVNGHPLNYLLTTPMDLTTTPINTVINQTVAKQLNLRVGDMIKMSTNGRIIEYKNDQGKFQKLALDDINFSNITNANVNETNVSLALGNTQFDSIPNLKGQPAFFNIGGPSAFTNQVQNGNVTQINDEQTYNFKVAGIYDGYGDPRAYISKTAADKLLGYDKTQTKLYEIFYNEWFNKTNQIIKEFIDFTKLPKTFSELVKLSKTDLNAAKILKIFNHEFPIFNLKLSQVDNVADITNSYTVTSVYGDYTTVGLNGGEYNGLRYSVNGEGSTANVLPLYVHQQLLSQISTIINMILIAFAVLSLVISFVIILLTSNLVIYENRKTIATMKVLGYSDMQITNIVIGMYLPIIAIMFIIGFPLGWYIIQAVINYLAYHSTWVLPLFFAWWLVPLVMLIVFGIYIITFIIGWYSMQKINPIYALKVND
ncbi:ABC transporter permease [Spiroplasma sp. DGKH1]|uniref:ABC transporter permease n=1 Tax=Spiroplasma sp. DGKH1 TaxID=3050074 RepID=UPI0034C69A4B